MKIITFAGILLSMNVGTNEARSDSAGTWEDLGIPHASAPIDQVELQIQDDLWKNLLSHGKDFRGRNEVYFRCIKGGSKWIFVALPETGVNETATFWLFDPKTKASEELKTDKAFFAPQAALWDGKRFLFWIDGGTSSSKSFGEIWAFEPESKKWEVYHCPLERLPGRLSTMIVTGDRIIVLGGIKNKWKLSKWFLDVLKFQDHGHGYGDYFSYDGVIFDRTSKTWKNIKRLRGAPKDRCEHPRLIADTVPFQQKREMWTGKAVLLFSNDGRDFAYYTEQDEWKRILSWDGKQGRALVL